MPYTIHESHKQKDQHSQNRICKVTWITQIHRINQCADDRHQKQDQPARMPQIKAHSYDNIGHDRYNAKRQAAIVPS